MPKLLLARESAHRWASIGAALAAGLRQYLGQSWRALLVNVRDPFLPIVFLGFQALFWC